MNKTIILNCIIYKDDNQYVSLCKQLDISSFGDTEEEAKNNLLEALQLYVSYAKEENLVQDLILDKISNYKNSKNIKLKIQNYFAQHYNFKIQI